MLNSLINQRLGRYDIKALLGRGGMAAVYRATDTTLMRDVALKVLYAQYGDDAGLIQRFRAEAVTAAALEHPNIVPVYDVGEEQGLAFIAMKLLTGETLYERLQAAGTIDLAELLGVLRPVAAALDYAHRKGVIHRDIKPANIFLSATPDGTRVMLTDFGIAKQLDTPGLTTTGALIGTPDYMAPEQIAGRAVDARTDVYALGMLAYRALTGRRAFEGSTQDVLLGHLYNDPLPPSRLNPALPPAVDGAILTAIAREPERRYPSAGAFAAAMAAAQHQASSGAAGTAVGALPALAASERTQQGTPPALATPVTPPARSLPSEQPATVRRPSSPAQPVRAPAATPAETAGAATIPAPRSSGATPWFLAVLLALVVGGLAVALALTLARGVGSSSLPTPLAPPATATTEPSATPAPSATPEPSASPEPSATVAPSATPEPSATPAPPTAAPTVPPTVPPTATVAPTTPPTVAPTATLEPTPILNNTPIAEDECDDDLLERGFGKVYEEHVRVRTGLGCPQEEEQAGEGSIQFFQQGTLFWWSDRNRTPQSDFIYAFFGPDGGEYRAFPPTEVAALAPTPTRGPDENQPDRGFGAVYFLVPGVREQLGPWQSEEIPLRGNQRAVLQPYERGLMIFTPVYRPTGKPTIFVLYNDGTFDRFDDTYNG